MTTTFVIVGDAEFFPGVLAATASIRAFHPHERVVVIDNHLQRGGLTASQHVALQNLDARLIPASALAREGRKLAAWELKAYAAEFLSRHTDLLVGMDADAVLCGPLHDVLWRAWEEGCFLGGHDRCPAYGKEFNIYGINAPVLNERYMSTSLYVCRTTPRNRAILQQWAECCAKSLFGGTGPYAGHGDQGVLNALLFAGQEPDAVGLLDNELWSQHHVYWQHPLELRDGRLFNLTSQSWQRAIHCGGTEKFWRPEHESKLKKQPLARVNHEWFLQMLALGIQRGGIPAVELLNGKAHARLLEAPAMRAAKFSKNDPGHHDTWPY